MTTTTLHVGFLGAGMMTAALAARWRDTGHEITIGGRDPQKTERLASSMGARFGSLEMTAASADVIVLAVRWEGVEWTLQQVKDGLLGKVLVDVTNPVETETFGVITPPGISMAEQVESASGSLVAKAFNLAHASVWTAPPRIDERPLAVPFATNHPLARAVVERLTADLGARALDAGELRNARYLESMAAVVIRRLFLGDPMTSTFAWVS